MNYYERHIGDYLKDTAHLSLLEHGVYTRLLDVYYTRESAIPDDQAARLIGARSKEEREALAAVLDEFFQKTESGWIQGRCELEIARFQDKQVKAKRSADARWGAQRTQSERNANASSTHDAPDMRTQSERNANGMHRAPVPRHQTPISNHQTPDIEDKDTHSAGELTREPDKPQRVSHETAICMAIRAEGIASTNPGHPDLKALIDKGAEVQNFVAAARVAREKGKGFAYVLGVVKGQLNDASEIATSASAQRIQPSETGHQRAMRDRFEEMTGKTKTKPMEAIDVTARTLD